jgi:hypothetical protein
MRAARWLYKCRRLGSWWTDHRPDNNAMCLHSFIQCKSMTAAAVSWLPLWGLFSAACITYQVQDIGVDKGAS